MVSNLSGLASHLSFLSLRPITFSSVRPQPFALLATCSCFKEMVYKMSSWRYGAKEYVELEIPVLLVYC